MKNRPGIIKKEALKIIIPPVLAISLLLTMVFSFAIPFFEKHLMEQKKLMLSSLNQVGMDVLAYYNQEALAGRLSMREARDAAIRQVRGLNYGPAKKDYFWINDMTPRIIMHPYRPDLEGKDVSKFSDPEGKLLFREFVNAVAGNGGGFVDYHWQWKDDPARIEKKISYVKLFRPWDWIIGTGVYIEDVRYEVAMVARDILSISGAIFLFIILLSIYIIRNNLMEINKRYRAEDEIMGYRDNLEELVKKRTRELEEAMSKVKILSGFLPICSSCKKIRDDRGYWNQIELYIREHSEAEFSHGICPDCAARLYPGLYDKKK